jgi:hypothetical protein
VLGPVGRKRKDGKPAFLGPMFGQRVCSLGSARDNDGWNEPRLEDKVVEFLADKGLISETAPARDNQNNVGFELVFCEKGMPLVHVLFFIPLKEHMEEVFVLRYTKERVITWLLCAKRLRVIKDVARHIAKVYLKEKTYHFAPSLGIACAPYQLQVYALITNGTYSIIDVAQKTNVEPCVAGIIALESRNKRVCVLCARPETETIVMDLVREMIGTKCTIWRCRDDAWIAV